MQIYKQKCKKCTKFSKKLTYDLKTTEKCKKCEIKMVSLNST